MTPEAVAAFLEELQLAVEGDDFWSGYLRFLAVPHQSGPALHLGVFVEPYLEFVLNGTKTIESRFSARRSPPYDRVQNGDVLLLKRSGGPVVGVCRVQSVWFYDLDPVSWRDIRQKYTQALCAQDPQFWVERETASFATLMRIGNVLSLASMNIAKRDRRGWVVLRPVGSTASASSASHVDTIKLEPIT